MNMTRSLIAIVLAVALANTYAANGAIDACSSNLAPMERIAPRLPLKLHNEFNGSATVTFILDRAGHVQAPVIVASEWYPIGRSRGQPLGYEDAILFAIKQWQYPAQSRSCRANVPVEIKHAES